MAARTRAKQLLLLAKIDGGSEDLQWPILKRDLRRLPRTIPVLCLAHVTNTMEITDRDFEKGEADGTADALIILETITKAIRLSSNMVSL
jgi:hypothetical protein